MTFFMERLKKCKRDEETVSCSEKGDLDCEVQGNFEKLIADLQHPDPHHDPDQAPEFFAELEEGQHPEFLVFACSDSQVSPSHILDFQPGEAFMAPNIANMVTAFEQTEHSGVGAIIEYAVGSLEVKNILVIGHSRCGGIKRLMPHLEDGYLMKFDFIDNWIRIGLPAKEEVQEKYWNLPLGISEEHSEKSDVYPYASKAVMYGTLKLWGGYYDFVNGAFELLDDAHIIPVQTLSQPLLSPDSQNEL
ncbi:hypothetical protein SLEP1_g29241 [Rubroshorea leprosula]|uniref:Carbonic anhydrase n=1 Tax=Rubroshorea leprosula TaxID=152421 RepID=A0AAV5K7Y4_9ROSI|nr:hypothetical protein SLEP1_g29241 [Rubroshorea leprosula]